MNVKIFLFLSLIVSSAVVAQDDYNQVDSRGRKQGPWRKQYEGMNQWMYIGQFKDDKPIGLFSYYYESSKIKAKIDHGDGSGRSVAVFYHENGHKMSTGIYRNMMKDSIWTNYGPSGRLSTKETYKNDQLNGQTVVFFVPEDPEDKSTRISEIFNYENGLIVGEYKRFFDNGQLMLTGKYENNLKEGSWTEFHQNGKRSAYYNYRKGQLNGWQMIYDTKELLKERVYYYQGRILEGEELDKYLKLLKDNNQNSND